MLAHLTMVVCKKGAMETLAHLVIQARVGLSQALMAREEGVSRRQAARDSEAMVRTAVVEEANQYLSFKVVEGPQGAALMVDSEAVGGRGMVVAAEAATREVGAFLQAAVVDTSIFKIVALDERIRHYL
eukprot:SAG31_NODE_10954_length_1079_cov_1.408163_1_plen_129_part_00